jgi:hypothetical protein
MSGLQQVFPADHTLAHILYDPAEGCYYDRTTDLYLTRDEEKAYGLLG